MINVRTIEPEDCPACLEIYNWYIENTTYTLEFDSLTEAQFLERIEQISSSYPYIVCEEDGRVLGYSYLDPFGVRKGYRYTCDLAIYVDRNCRKKGVGKALMEEILRRGREQGLRDVIAVITDENENSLAFHRHMGFKEAGRLNGVADKFGRRFGVVYMQKTIA